MSGFKRCGVYPINLGAVSDRQLAPSKALRSPEVQHTDVPLPDSPPFTSEEKALYERRFQEGYDIPDPSYLAWLKITHPAAVVSAPTSEAALSVSGSQGELLSEGCQKSVTSKSTTSAVASGHSSQILSEILVFPEPQMKSMSKRKLALSSKTVCITNDEVLERLKAQEAEKCDTEAIRKAKQLDKQQKKRE